ncbi:MULTISPECIES: hypothetical protein [Aneurinibacillus]|uniref:Uncharacterized protein n=1 Tax=Aneurinibacillus thermoaerophilus TaxID=143495 RepID=A0ABX8YCF3_ANETH|nr:MULTISPECIES: hypothetical protein [Aneurinibacillus]AMA74012.1 hypothetical protein ACH33_14975 [Aneurinibacillus sp. XH2]MED0737212.1 hypothetical protein [Aneurinibacillus thermoaerophilus]QYY43403.1 hypothetical protein K3F53_03895 [Aneurinibacillus thermoaerophilus]
MIIQPLFLTNIVQDMDNRIDHALVNVAGELAKYPIFRSEIQEKKLTVYIYIPDNEAIGKQILGASLMSKDGNTLANKPLNAIKGDKGFLIAFEFSVEVKVKTNGV